MKKKTRRIIKQQSLQQEKSKVKAVVCSRHVLGPHLMINYCGLWKLNVVDERYLYVTRQ